MKYNYVFSDYVPIHTIIINEAKIATIKHIKFIKPDSMIYLTTLNIIDVYGFSSIFDAIYAAQL